MRIVIQLLGLPLVDIATGPDATTTEPQDTRVDAMLERPDPPALGFDGLSDRGPTVTR